MPAPKQIVQALDNSFPRPRVDHEWLEQCCAWIEEEKHLSPINDYDQFLENVNDQLIKSDLKDSMHHGTGLNDISTFTGNLSGPPLLVQILEITDIGVSAFQLEQVRAVREERLSAGEGDEEGDEEGDLEVEGEGPLPKYPRATLQLILSDGQTVFSAMEYRRIPELVLGTTPLGFKLQLNGTRFSNGIVFLEPATIILIGGSVDDLESQQKSLFKQSLYRRMGQSIREEPPLPPPPNLLPSRVPLRDISPPVPTLHDDDVDMEPRRRMPAIPTTTAAQPIPTSNTPRPLRPLPTRQLNVQIMDAENTGEHQSSSVITAHRSRSASTSPHFPAEADSTRTGQSADDLDFTLSPTTRQRAIPFSFDSPVSTPARPNQSQSGKPKRDSFDFDLLDEFDAENFPPKSSDKGKERTANYPEDQKKHFIDGDSSDYGMDDDVTFADSTFLESLDRVEKQALESSKTPSSTFPPNLTIKTDFSQGSSSGGGSRIVNPTPLKSSADVIEIEDESDEDKENAFVPMRHVRQRREESEMPRGRSPTTSQRRETSQTSSQKKGKAAVRHTSPNDVIDISDSD